ncbi:hypothetical protein ACS0TY_014279 [Phlomoides rotata]
MFFWLHVMVRHKQLALRTSPRSIVNRVEQSEAHTSKFIWFFAHTRVTQFLMCFC